MSCAAPPALDDTQLLAYLDEAADAGVKAHLARCPACRARAARLARMEARLRGGLYRATCPPAGELGEYGLGTLSRAQAAPIRRHVATCPHCARELAQLQRFLGDLAPEPEPGLLDEIGTGLRVLLARLMGPAGGAMGGFGPALAGVRGATGGPAVYQAGEFQIIVEVHPQAGSDERPGRRSLLGLLAGGEAQGTVVDLWQDGRLVQTVPVDELGNFLAPDILPGTYELVLRGPGLEVHVEELQV